jgi:hypothetical protein
MRVLSRREELPMGANADRLVGRTLLGVDDKKIGRINAIYVNATTGEPEWVAVGTGGLFGAKLVFAPVAEVTCGGEDALVAFDKKYVMHAPKAQSEGALSPAENGQLYRYYGIGRGQTEASGSQDAALWLGR